MARAKPQTVKPCTKEELHRLKLPQSILINERETSSSHHDNIACYYLT